MKKINKMCSFYVNDWHLTVMMLPYISNKLQKKEKITIISEEDLEANLKTILDKTNMNDITKKEITQIGWSKTLVKNINTKISEIEGTNNIIIIGNEKYIEDTNKTIENKVKTGEINVVNCYEVMQFNNNIENILKNHEKVINTAGEKDIQDFCDGFSKKEVI